MLLAITAAALAEGVGIAALLPMIGLVIGAEGAGGALTLTSSRSSPSPVRTCPSVGCWF